jgi:arabinofuranosyltransferase
MSNASNPSPTSRSLPWLLLVLALLTVYAYAVWRAAWVGDDALITMRVVDNFVSGEGLRWNPTDRVQVSTHPLWMFGLSAAYGITGDAYFAPLWLSGLCLVGTFALLLSSRLLPLRGAVLALTLLIASKSFVDYSTSGLENPLSFLLVTWLFVALERRVNREGRFLPLALASSLLILNRPDHAVLVAPVLLIGAWGRPLWETLRDLVVGFAPLLLWLAFATLYFGTPIPITAHAKALSLGVPQEQMMAQALNYFADAVYRDPVTLLGLALALVMLLMGLVRRAPRTQLAMGLSVLLSLLYLFKIGGDFMAGRFFATPLLLAAILLARSQLVARLQNPALLGAAALVLGASFLSSPPTLLSPSVYGGFELSPKGVVDERAHYYEGLGLRSPGRIPLIAGALSPMIEADPSPVPQHVVVPACGGLQGLHRWARDARRRPTAHRPAARATPGLRARSLAARTRTPAYPPRLSGEPRHRREPYPTPRAAPLLRTTATRDPGPPFQRRATRGHVETLDRRQRSAQLCPRGLSPPREHEQRAARATAAGARPGRDRPAPALERSPRPAPRVGQSGRDDRAPGPLPGQGAAPRSRRPRRLRAGVPARRSGARQDPWSRP